MTLSFFVVYDTICLVIYMKKFLLIFMTAFLILTFCSCSCGSDPTEITNKVETEANSETKTNSEAVVSDDEEDIFGDENIDDNAEESNSDHNSFPDATSQIIEPSVKKPEKIGDNISVSTYASYLTEDEWLSLSNDDTLVFNDNGTFSGKINGKDYSGTFNMKVKEKGVCILGVTLKGTKTEVEYTVKFKNSAYITITTNTGDSASYASY